MQQPRTVGTVNQPKPAESFRNFAAEERPSVREFYRQNHTHQTVDFVRAKSREYLYCPLITVINTLICMY